ncbi:hypothetical protein BEL05_19080 [Shewanella colwelliana]|uniref:Carrier domain-containing protein n=1 Tax=Shewanella colwelliana TaxID=23 RepID=A0A1E5IVC6_SHECO|nr:hypothetical protein [Shewanella colwelliana]OEG74539.1 hypothetical protein BEL05_19080 [Shewanella colwelliana]
MSNTAKVIEIVQDIIEMDNVTASTILTEDIWDSFAVISFLSSVQTEFNTVVDAEKVSNVETVQELIELIS